LKLKVNEAKSAVAQPWQRKFLGFMVSDNHLGRSATIILAGGEEFKMPG
jgi:hypothetical protein